MTTTNEPTIGVYEALEHLPNVQPDPTMLELVDRLTEAGQQLYPLLVQAKQLLEDHEAASERIVGGLRDRAMLDGQGTEGLYGLLDVLSGGRALHVALSTLRDLCDPEEAMPNVELLTSAMRGDRRAARRGEVCDCGQPAVTVFLTTDHGEVPYCGVPHQGEQG